MNDNVSRSQKKIPVEAESAQTILGLLAAVETGREHTQRSLASQLGVALGLTNSLIKRCVKKGLVKIKDAPARRYAYYLTPKGFKEKSRLTAEYLSISLNFFRQARSEFDDILEFCQVRGWSKIALVGVSDFAEICLLAGMETGLSPVAFIDTGKNASTHCGIPVYASLAELISKDGEIDAVIITETRDPQAIFEQIRKSYPEEKILTPNQLHIVRELRELL